MVQISFHQWHAGGCIPHLAAPKERDKIHVWVVTIPQHDSELGDFKRILNQTEQQRAERFLAPDARRQFVCGRLVLRQVLGECLQAAPARLAFGFQLAGKPYLLPPESAANLRFSLSHSAALVAVAVARGLEVGVDVEWIHGIQDWTDLQPRVLSAREYAGLHALPPARHRQAFFNAWTRKEAWLKATGEGLIDNLFDIEVTLSPGQEANWIRLPGGAEIARQWSLHNLDLPPGYAGAVVAQKCPVPESAGSPVA